MTSPIQLMSNEGSVTVARGVSMWNESKGKRLFDLFLAAVLLVLVSPVMLAVALVVKLTSKGPVFYRQWRVGKEGHEFQLIKFRTMAYERQPGPRVTRAGDPRITGAGRVLRQWKLDELPQLLNVVRGDMSFVGPRPDVAEYLTFLDSELRKILDLRPGLTGAATLCYRHEEKLLSQVPEAELQKFYCTQVLPEKVRIDLDYARKAGLMSDLVLLLRTFRVILT
jgi:lipopolysaccharide/colanic/teichoic acid biosynthesis glycosyltransferase